LVVLVFCLVLSRFVFFFFFFFDIRYNVEYISHMKDTKSSDIKQAGIRVCGTNTD